MHCQIKRAVKQTTAVIKTRIIKLNQPPDESAYGIDNMSIPEVKMKPVRIISPKDSEF